MKLWSAQNYEISLTDKAKEFLVKTGFDTNFGARPLLRTIQRYVENPLAERLLACKHAKGGSIMVGLEEGEKEQKLTFDIEEIKPKEISAAPAGAGEKQPQEKKAPQAKEPEKDKEKKASKPHKEHKKKS
jgi:hypothetical protein